MKYIIGLDMGIASVGFATVMLDKKRTAVPYNKNERANIRSGRASERRFFLGGSAQNKPRHASQIAPPPFSQGADPQSDSGQRHYDF